MKPHTNCLIASLGFAALLGSLSGHAATANVSIVDFAFSPPSVTINVGDSVTWQNMGNAPHTATSDTGLWGSSTLTHGGTFTHTFTAAGTFPYHCAVHTSMRASVIVQSSGNAAPTVAITSPTNNQSFLAGTPIIIQASASDSDGTVAKVEFFDSAISLRVASVSPYKTTNTLAVGVHHLTAVATDNLGATTTSAAVTVTVTNLNLPPIVAIISPTNNDTFLTSTVITLQASASDPDGTVGEVRFFDNAVFLGITVSPYKVTGSLPAGIHHLTAVATDNLGAKATSAVVTVTVTLPNLPPTVAIISPTNNQTLLAGAAFTLRASASDPDGTVAKVQFFDGALSLGVVSVSPYLITNTLAAGVHLLTAVATDNAGASTTSAAVSVNVANAVPIVLSSPRRLSATAFQFNYTANPGLSYRVRRSSNLTNWVFLSTNTAAGATVHFLDASATGQIQAYSVQRLPNP